MNIKPFIKGDTWIDIYTSRTWYLKDHWHFLGKKSDYEIRSLEFLRDINIPCSKECSLEKKNDSK